MKKAFFLSLCISVHILGLSRTGFANEVSVPSSETVTQHYVVMAHAMFTEAQAAGADLALATDALLRSPNEANHLHAKQAWVTAHRAYSRTEVFRFGNPNVDDWEGQVNAWPMDEGLVDYVADGYVSDSGNPFAQKNLIADAVVLDQALLRDMHEGAGAEANVATGYHVIEFLLWGQDLNLTKVSAGTRSYLDFSQSQCASVHCDRRALYLKESVDLLLADLADMVQQWQLGQGDYAKTFMALSVDTRLQRMLFGLGSLVYGELAGERIRVAMLAQSQEDEQSCFSDMTHFAIKENVDAVADVFNGIVQAKGQRVAGPSLSDLLLANNAKKHQALMLAFTKAQNTVDKVAQQAKNGLPFDQQILLENIEAYSTLELLIAQLRDQAILIESIDSQQLAMVKVMR